MNKRKRQLGMTLIEVLVATIIFASICMIAITVTIHMNSMMYQNRLQGRLQEEAHYIMEYINREVAKSSDVTISRNNLTIVKANETIVISITGNKLTLDTDADTLTHNLSSGDLKITDYTLTQINVVTGSKPVFKIQLTLKPEDKNILISRKSAYLGGDDKLGQLVFSLNSTFSVPD